MKKHINSKIGLLLCSFFYISTATAATFDFSYTNLGVSGGATHTSVGMSDNGIDVEVQAYTIDNDGAGNINNKSLINSAHRGVYVSSRNSGNLGVRSRFSDSNSLDGGHRSYDPDEGLLFSFDSLVSLEYINFDYFYNDTFNLTVDGVSTLFNINRNSVSPLVSGVPSEADEFYFFNITGKEFLFWADDNSARFRIDTLKVSAVPIPAALFLFAPALLAFFGFRRKAQA